MELTPDGLCYQAEHDMDDIPAVEYIQPTERQWQNFRATLDRLEVWDWQRRYEPEDVICDGTSWSVEIVYDDRALRTAGSNDFPEDPGATPETPNPHKRFDRFLRAISRLTDGRPFE